MSGIMPELILGLVRPKETTGCLSSWHGKENGLDSRFIVSVAWRPNETSHARTAVFIRTSRHCVDFWCNCNRTLIQ
jgi:hypothetical protein